MEQLADKCSYFQIIDEEQRELFIYGLRNAVYIAANMLLTIVIGNIFGCLEYAVIFTIAFLMLRIYTGGYHSTGRLRCYVESCILIIGNACFVKYVALSELNIRLLIFVCFCTALVPVWRWSPISNSNRPLADEEKLDYAAKARKIFLVEAAAAVLLAAVNCTKAAQTVSLAVLLCAVLIAVGKGIQE